jgi:hemerythrin-like domain-containing protein
MNMSIKRLVDDHINLRYILVVLARYVTQCQTKGDLYRSVEFIKVALDYLSDYPQLFHHPVEERLIHFLSIKDPSIFKIGDDVASQHRELERNTSMMRDQFYQDLQINSDQQFTELKNRLLELIDQHHHHLKDEEKYFIPVLERAMTPEDWVEFWAIDNKKHPDLASAEKRGEFASSLLYLAKRAKRAETAAKY